MPERPNAIIFKGNSLTLVGNEVGVGDTAPDCTLIANDLSEKRLSDFQGRPRLLSVVPSLDTPVCDTQTRRFNQEATQLANDTQVLTISMDLPFAQKRWCGDAGVDRAETLSDYRDRAFGEQYGLLIKELGLLARCVMVVDRNGIVRHRELVAETGREPNYEAALEAARAAA